MQCQPQGQLPAIRRISRRSEASLVIFERPSLLQRVLLIHRALLLSHHPHHPRTLKRQHNRDSSPMLPEESFQRVSTQQTRPQISSRGPKVLYKRFSTPQQPLHTSSKTDRAKESDALVVADPPGVGRRSCL